MSEPLIDGADKFKSPGHEKGMQQCTLPEDLEEDLTSGYRPASAGDMVKPPTKLPHPSKSKSPRSLKSKDKYKDKVKDMSKDKGKSKNKTHKLPWTEGDDTGDGDDNMETTRDDTEHGQDDAHLVHEDNTVPPDPSAEHFTHIPKVGGEAPVLWGDRRSKDTQIARLYLTLSFSLLIYRSKWLPPHNNYWTGTVTFSMR